MPFGDGTFQGGMDIDAGLPASSVALGDLNGDGNLDVVVADPYQSEVNVFLRNSDGTFRPPAAYSADFANWVTLADLNGDGILDLVTLDYGNASVRVFMGKGDGTFGAAVDFPAGPNPKSVKVADLNNDGIPDIIESGSGANVLLGNGDGTFRAPITIQGASGSFQAPVAADFNNDGKLDLVLNGQIFFGNGDGTFGPPINLFNSGLAPPMAAGDLNGDGNVDLVFTNGANIEVMLGNGNGTFQSPVSYVADNGVAAVLVGEVMGDGIPDILALNGAASELWVFAGKGDGSFQAGVKYATGSGPQSLALADMDGNGLPDVVMADSGSHFSTFTVLFNAFAPTTLTPSSIAEGSGDFTLTVNGGPFSTMSTVEWNGKPLSTTFVSSSELQATVPAADVVDEGTANITVTGSGDIPPSQFSILENDALSATGYNLAGIEGNEINGIVATFTDVTYPANSPGDFNATINWGDGTTSNGTVTTQGNLFVVRGSHTYAEKGSYSIAVGIQDDGSGVAAATTNSTATIADAPLTAMGVPVTATEGQPLFGTVATFTDGNPNASSSDFTAVVDWGNGTVSQEGIFSAGNGRFQVVLPGPSFEFVGQIPYSEEGHYTVTTTITDVDGSKAVATSTATVADAALTATGTPVHAVEGVAFSGQVATFTDANPKAPLGDFIFDCPFCASPIGFPVSNALVDWGDGTPTSRGDIAQPGGVGTTFVVSGDHTYAKAGSYSISVRITDNGGSTTTTTTTATVTDPSDIVGRAMETGQIWVGTSTGSSFNSSLWAGWNPGANWVDVLTGDFNGDGLTDVAARDANTGAWWVALSTGSSFTTTRWDTWSTHVTWTDVQVGDFNGGGKMDIIGRPVGEGHWWVGLSTGSSFVTTLWETWGAVTWVDVKVGDFNGDGKADITARDLGTGAWWTGISTGSSFTTSMWAVWSTAVTWVDVQVGDFNGDGFADIAGRALETGQWWVAFANGTVGPPAPRPVPSTGFDTTFWTTWSTGVTWVDVKVGDFNGDGSTDIIGRALETGQWWVNLSPFRPCSEVCTVPPTPQPAVLFATWSTGVTWVDVQVGDFNGDGKSDITGRALETGQWWTGLSNGSAFTNSLWATWSTGVTWTGVRSGDFA